MQQFKHKQLGRKLVQEIGKEKSKPKLGGRGNRKNARFLENVILHTLYGSRNSPLLRCHQIPALKCMSCLIPLASLRKGKRTKKRTILKQKKSPKIPAKHSFFFLVKKLKVQVNWVSHRALILHSDTGLMLELDNYMPHLHQIFVFGAK